MIENTIVDEANDRTYVVMADRALSDGEIYSAIRLKLRELKAPLGAGEKLVFSASAHLGRS